jgi:hypothetical protein
MPTLCCLALRGTECGPQHLNTARWHVTQVMLVAFRSRGDGEVGRLDIAAQFWELPEHYEGQFWRKRGVKAKEPDGLNQYLVVRLLGRRLEQGHAPLEFRSFELGAQVRLECFTRKPRAIFIHGNPKIHDTFVADPEVLFATRDVKAVAQRVSTELAPLTRVADVLDNARKVPLSQSNVERYAG